MTKTTRIQVHFPQGYNQRNVNDIANHFHTSNQKAVQFALWHVYQVKTNFQVTSFPTKIRPRRLVRNIFIPVTTRQASQLRSKAQSMGCSIAELARRSVEVVAKKISEGELKGYEPECTAFFPLPIY